MPPNTMTSQMARLATSNSTLSTLSTLFQNDKTVTPDLSPSQEQAAGIQARAKGAVSGQEGGFLVMTGGFFFLSVGIVHISSGTVKVDPVIPFDCDFGFTMVLFESTAMTPEKGWEKEKGRGDRCKSVG